LIVLIGWLVYFIFVFIQKIAAAAAIAASGIYLLLIFFLIISFKY